jgi:signal peptidase I
LPAVLNTIRALGALPSAPPAPLPLALVWSLGRGRPGRSPITRFIVFTLVVLGALTGVLRLTCIRWWQIPVDDPDLAASIAPTLDAGDWVVLWRGFEPSFGDLVVCPDPDDPAEVVIGRIAAEPGDVLEIDDRGWLKVNGSRIGADTACNIPKLTVQHPRSGDRVALRCDIELLGGRYHQRAVVPPQAPLKPLAGKREVGAGSVFLVSDNRYLPFDSRDFGPVAKATCRETVAFRLVSRLGFSHVATRLSWIQ